MRWGPPGIRQSHGTSRRAFLKATGKTVLGLSVGAGVGNLLNKSAAASEERPAGTESGTPLPGKTGFVFHEEYVRHTLGPRHPESPERLKAILRRMKSTGLDQAVTPVSPEGNPLPWIRTIHTESHIRLVARQAYDDSICRLAVAGALSAVDAVCEGRVRNAFCALRPPGHHATDGGESGFCFFNNVAIAARYAQQKHGLAKVLIADWDYHHGDGTEWAFYEDPSVLFFSTHRLEAYPGTGFPERRGRGKGYGYNINVPLPANADDRAILRAFETTLVPAADRFEPDFVLISAGFDSREDDLLGDFAVTDEGFAGLTRIMMSIAQQHARGRLVSVLEGGYNPSGLALAVESHIRTLLNA